MSPIFEKRLTRFLEIIPGFTSWILLLLPIFLALYDPRLLAYFIITFDFYWLSKAILTTPYLIVSHMYMVRDSKVDWFERCQLLDSPADLIEREKRRVRTAPLWLKKRAKEELNKIEEYVGRGEQDKKSWRDIYHILLLPHYKDEYNILRSAVESAVKSSYPMSRTILVVALEEREQGEEKFEKFNKIKKEFSPYFFDIFYTMHPDDLPGEIKGKSANIKWAGQEIKRYIDKKKISYDDVIVSAFDGDTRVSPEYFACLTYNYLIHPERTKRTYQPIPLFNNNIWEVPFLVRLVSYSSSFWQMLESCRPYRLINFSSQAMSFSTLVDIDFWDEKIVSEDSRQFYRTFFRYGGNHKAVPLFTPVYMDAVMGDTLWQTLKNQYLQKRRWAWGLENFPYTVIESIKHTEISWRLKFPYLRRLFFGSVEWATASLLIAFAGWLPFLLNADFRESVISYNLPIIARNILSFTWFGIVMSTYIGIIWLPKRPVRYSKLKYVEMVAQWIFVPITAILFGSIPALDAQTRMMLGGKYRLGFWVTPKKFVKRDEP